MRRCVICNQPIELSGKRKTCSSECSRRLRSQLAHARMSDPATQEQLRANLQAKYGVSNPMQIKEVAAKSHAKWEANKSATIAKAMDTIRQRYGGVGWGYTNHLTPEENSARAAKISSTMRQRAAAGHQYGNANPETRSKQTATMLDRYGVKTGYELPGVWAKCAANQGRIISKLNREWQQYLADELGVNFEFEVAVGNFHYDLGYGKLLIDINPTVTHNSTYSYNHLMDNSQPNQPLAPDYHHQRWLNAVEHGYQLISVFDWMDRAKILDIVRAKLHLCSHRVAARQCTVHELSTAEARQFINAVHIQGYTPAKVKLGLKYEDQLIMVMTFGEPRFNNRCDWELIRLATAADWQCVGGRSKLLSYFRRNYDCNRLLCYTNLNISSTTEGEYVPNYGLWVKGQSTVNSNTILRRGASRFVGDPNFVKYPYGKFSNDKIMELEGWVKVYDCGSMRSYL